MRTKRTLIQISLLMAWWWGLPTLVQAQFTFTTDSGSITITGYTGSGGAVIIPSSTSGLPVTGIGQNAFIEISTITSVKIPISVTSIGYEAFGMCTNLADAMIPDSITNMGKYAFFKCSALTNITIPSGLPSSKMKNSDFAPVRLGTNDEVIVVEACTNLAAANWQLLQTNTLAGMTFNFTDSQWKNYRPRFYILLSP